MLQNVLIPFLLFETYVLIATSNGGQNLSGNLLNTALMLSGLPQDKLSRFTKMIWTAKSLFQDLCVYLFASLICHQVYTLLM